MLIINNSIRQSIKKEKKKQNIGLLFWKSELVSLQVKKRLMTSGVCSVEHFHLGPEDRFPLLVRRWWAERVTVRVGEGLMGLMGGGDYPVVPDC